MENRFDNVEDISCSICFDPFKENDHIPKVLECGHTFCSNCVEKLIGNQNSVCSICQKTIVIKESYPTNFTVLSLLEQKEKSKRGNLKLEEAIATFQSQFPEDFKICEESIARKTKEWKTIDSLITGCDSVMKILNESKIEEMENAPLQKALEKLYELVDKIHNLKAASMAWIKLTDFDDQKGFMYKVYAESEAGPVSVVHSVGKKNLYGRVSVVGNEIYVHSLSSQECERSGTATYVVFQDFKECWMNQYFEAFMKIECNEGGLKVIVKIQLENSQLVNQFLKLCTGELGPTYKGVTYVTKNKEWDDENTSNIICIRKYVSNGELRSGEIDYVDYSDEDAKNFTENEYVCYGDTSGLCAINKINKECGDNDAIGIIKNINNLEDLFSCNSEKPLKILDCGVVFKLT